MHHKLQLSCVALSQYYQGHFSFIKPRIWVILNLWNPLFFQAQAIAVQIMDKNIFCFQIQAAHGHLSAVSPRQKVFEIERSLMSCREGKIRGQAFRRRCFLIVKLVTWQRWFLFFGGWVGNEGREKREGGGGGVWKEKKNIILVQICMFS